jgi:hypothetical protein
MSETNIPKEVSTAIERANNVDTGQQAHHIALLAMLAAARKLPDDEVFPMISLYTMNRHEGSPVQSDGKRKYGLCTNATFKWLETHFGIHVREGVAQRGNTWQGKGFTDDTFERARAYPWFAMANDMAFKVPAKVDFASAATAQARLEVTGETPMTDAQVLEAWKLAMKAARNSKKLEAWANKYQDKVAKGEIKIAA